MSHNKISVVLLGNVDYLKKSLITMILGKDAIKLSKTGALKNREIYQDDTFVFTCISDTNNAIKELFLENPVPDVCLLMVENGFSLDHVWQQIGNLNKVTGKPRDEFIVVLPGIRTTTDYPFRCYTMLQFFTQLNDLVKMKDETNMRTDYNPESQHQMDTKGGRFSNKTYEDPMMTSKRKCTITNVNLVLVGMAGTGKSASANSILGREAFLSTSSSSSVTTECQVEQREMNGIHVRVIDTPDIFDEDMPSSVRDKHVKRSKQLCESKPCVFVLVMHVSRFTDGERDILKKLEKAFGSKVREKTVILFTRGDDLKHARMSLDDFLHRCQPALKEIIQKCGNRCVLFENMTNSCQVEKLMNLAIALSKQ